jgi:hypothetical protein
LCSSASRHSCGPCWTVCPTPGPTRIRTAVATWQCGGCWRAVFLISLFYKAVYAEGIVPELSVFAAFTTLLVFLPAMLAVAVGRRLVDRTRPPQERRRVTDGVETDVFDAVRDDDPRTGAIAPIAAASAGAAAVDYPETYTSPVALAEREEADDATEQIAGQIHDETAQIESEIDRLQAEGDTKY